MTKITIPFQKHPAFPILAHAALNSKYCKDLYEILIPHGKTEKLDAIIKKYDLIEKNDKGKWDLTEKGKEAQNCIMQSHWLGYYNAGREWLGRYGNPLNIDVLKYLIDNGPKYYHIMKNDIIREYSSFAEPRKVSRQIWKAAEYLGYRSLVMEEGVSIKKRERRKLSFVSDANKKDVRIITDGRAVFRFKNKFDILYDKYINREGHVEIILDRFDTIEEIAEIIAS